MSPYKREEHEKEVCWQAVASLLFALLMTTVAYVLASVTGVGFASGIPSLNNTIQLQDSFEYRSISIVIPLVIISKVIVML